MKSTRCGSVASRVPFNSHVGIGSRKQLELGEREIMRFNSSSVVRVNASIVPGGGHRGTSTLSTCGNSRRIFSIFPMKNKANLSAKS